MHPRGIAVWRVLALVAVVLFVVGIATGTFGLLAPAPVLVYQWCFLFTARLRGEILGRTA